VNSELKAKINGLLDSIKEELEKHDGLILFYRCETLDLSDSLDDIEKIRALLDEA
jgi:hypothetical protein